MNRTRVLQEIRIMRFEEIYQWKRTKNLTLEEAAEILGVHERTFRRWSRRYEDEGIGGLADRRLDKVAHNAAPVDEVMAVVSLFETRYPQFTVAHFYDKYCDDHRGQRSYSWVKRQLQDAGLVKPAKKKGAHRRKRERRPMKGMMLHQDASTHEWVPGKHWDLVVTMDDADNEIYSMFFVEEEGTHSSFQGVKEVIKKHGIFCTLYTDRGSHYWNTPKAGGKIDKSNPTQFKRAMDQLGIEMIAAYSPEARGRSERMFGTLQGRLPKELALAEITDIDAANRFIEKKFIPAFNARFKVKARDEESCFVPWYDNHHITLDDILCIHSQRTVRKDNTVIYGKKLLQIEKDHHRYSYANLTVKIHEYVDKTLAVHYGHRCIGRYDGEGQVMSRKAKKRAA